MDFISCASRNIHDDGFTDGKRFSSSKILKSKFQSLENGESRNYELTTRRSLNKCKSIRHQPLKATRS